jgi:2-keto-3-deoxy-L-rhamnonate aldolase RhmA
VQASSERRAAPCAENKAHAAEIVAASRYAPRGLRGNAGHSPGTDYDLTGTAAERRAFANRQVFVTVMFETAAAFNDLDAIAAMDGIDALTIGPADLSQDLGVFGTPDQARVLDEKRDLVLAAAKKHGKTCAMLCSSYEQAQQWKTAGALLLAYSSDSEVLHGGYSAAMARIKG